MGVHQKVTDLNRHGGLVPSGKTRRPADSPPPPDRRGADLAPRGEGIVLPPSLALLGEEKWGAFERAARAEAPAWRAPGQLAEEGRRVFAFSDFAARAAVRRPALLRDLLDSGDLGRAYPTGHHGRGVATHLHRALADAAPAQRLEGLHAALRAFRQREMVRIAWRDLSGRADLEQTMNDLSDLADACIEAALDRLHPWLSEVLGRPGGGRNDDAPRLVVIAMGKLGARELNFSSDVDLIFAFAQPGRTVGGDRSVTHEEFFTRLARQLIQALSVNLADGFVFRVDPRLRPYGDGGPLVFSFDSLEHYYQRQGREWERYAWIKARPAAGDLKAGAHLLDRLHPFVYRRYLDFGAFESLRDMKSRIAHEVRRKQLAHNIKLGPGGIREVEFFGQMFQLLRGGVVPALQERRILAVLPALVAEGAIDPAVCRDLTQAYIFLRRVENRLQAVADQQTHDLPQSADDRLRLALSMGFPDWEAFVHRLAGHTGAVHRHFQGLLAGPEEAQSAGAGGGLHETLVQFWHSLVLDEAARRGLAEAGFGAPEAVRPLLEHLHQDPTTRALSVEGRQRLDRLLPVLIQAAGRAEQPVLVLNRIVDLLLSIQRRTNYLALLLENPSAVDHLVRLVGASPWVSAFLARHPVLLDELLDARTLYRPNDKAAVAAEAERRLAAVPDGDLEYQVEELCILRQTNTLRVAAADVTGALPIMRTSDYLSELAEVVLEKVLDLAWQHLQARHGSPACILDGRPCGRGFVVIGYGKLGGLELGYGSDLDLVFLHAGSELASTDGSRPISNAQFFARIGQRIVHVLTAHTRAGRIYEVDMRLRPSGTGGPLVVHVDGFRDYQRHQAWTWEHQAIVRARPVAGDPLLARKFDAVRAEILQLPRDPDALRREVRGMRERLRAERLRPEPAIFDLREDRGGIVDIEFIVQFLVLLESHRHPQLVAWTDNVRLLQTLIQTGVLDEDSAFLLREAYLTFRAKAHQLSLREQPPQVPEARFAPLRDRVRQVWTRIMGR